MGAILEFKKPQDPHAQGDAFCLSCNHAWHTVAPVGVHRLECPSCKRHMGIFKFAFAPPADMLLRTCECDNQLFYITPDGHMCPRCGTY